MVYSVARLSRELISALGNGIVHGCRSAPRDIEDAGQPPEMWAPDWILPPTPAQLATAAAVLAAHDPDGDKKEEATARARLLLLADKLDAGTATAADTREALARLVRRHLGVR